MKSRYPKKVLEAKFYTQGSEAQPVRIWLKSLPAEERREIGMDIKSIEYGWPIGMPTVRHISHGLWEVRSSLKNRIARVFFFTHGKDMILLHGIIKK